MTPITEKELAQYARQLAAMDDADFTAERAQVLRELAAAREAVALLADRPAPDAVPAGVDLADPVALADYLETARTAGTNAEALSAGRAWVRQCEQRAGPVRSEETSRARRRAGEALRADVLAHAALAAEFAGFVRAHHQLARQVGGRPLVSLEIVNELDRLLKQVNG